MLEKKIGQGGYSSVWKVVRKSDGQPYALKVTSLRSLSRLDCEAVVEEVRLLASLEHPCIVRYFETFVLPSPPRLCIVMELCPAGDLRGLLKQVVDGAGGSWQPWATTLTPFASRALVAGDGQRRCPSPPF